ncbi:MAG: hypothetical protein KIT45_15100 [Fimbriimonadia bacterium]|nr:hypothetical protein [Fimbriimonadia bacterium]
MKHMKITTLSALAVIGAAAFAQPAIDGRNIPSEFCRPLAQQTNFTGFGDHVEGVNYGSEINVLYAYIDSGNLYVAITGNLEGNGNAIHLLIDTGRNPNHSFSLDTGCVNCSAQGMSGVVFDHKPDYIVGVNRFDGGEGNDNIYCDLHDLMANVSTYLGSAPVNTGDGTINGGDNSAGLRIALDNSNIVGVTSDGGNVGDPFSATTGIEYVIPLAALGNPSSIRLQAMVTGGADLGDACHGTYLSNQSLPALNAFDLLLQYPNIEWARCPGLFYNSFPFNFQVEAPGDQFVTVPILADVNGDGCVNDDDLLAVLFNFGGTGVGDLDCDGTVSDRDLLIVLFNFGVGC